MALRLLYNPHPLAYVGAGKQELEPSVCAAAELLVCDSRTQCIERGEMQHAVAAGLLDPTATRVVEIGDVLQRGDKRAEKIATSSEMADVVRRGGALTSVSATHGASTHTLPSR